MFYPDEIRYVSQVPNLSVELAVNDRELSMAELLIEHYRSMLPNIPMNIEHVCWTSLPIRSLPGRD